MSDPLTPGKSPLDLETIKKWLDEGCYYRRKDWGRNGLYCTEPCIEALIAEVERLRAEKEAAQEPPFACGRCGQVGEFYEHWHICEDCFKTVYPEAAAALATSREQITPEPKIQPPYEGDLSTEHPNRCKLRDNLLYADILEGGKHRRTWRCHKREGHDGPCSAHNDCGVISGGAVCSLLPGHAGPHAWETPIVISLKLASRDRPHRRRLTVEEASQTQPCLYTLKTGKHERHLLHSVHQANAPVWFRRCPQCGWIDLDDLIEQVRGLPPVPVEGLDQLRTKAETLKIRLYENGTNVNQPLVDDVERFSLECEQAMRQRDSVQGTNNKLRKEVESLRARLAVVEGAKK